MYVCMFVCLYVYSKYIVYIYKYMCVCLFMCVCWYIGVYIQVYFSYITDSFITISYSKYSIERGINIVHLMLGVTSEIHSCDVCYATMVI